MSRRLPRPWPALALALLLVLVTGPATAVAASRDKTAPTAPANLRVTGTTSYGISVTWDAAKDNVGVTGYKVCCANTSFQTIAAPATSMVYTAGVEAGRTFTLYAYARDAAGNWSRASNGVSVTTPPDTTPPTKPSVAVTDIGSGHVSLAWSSVEDGPNVWFTVFRDGVAVLTGSRATSADFGFLDPGTTYTFTVQATDFGGNLSPLSDPLTVTTEPPDTSDTTGPTTPGNLYASLAMPDGETWLAWDDSIDDTTPQSLIAYRVYVNGVFNSAVVGFGREIVYGTPFSLNTYSVIAVDENGNESAPATIVVSNN